MSTTNTTVVNDAVVTIVNPNKSVITLAPQSISVVETSSGAVSYDLTEGADLIREPSATKVRVLSPTFTGVLSNLAVAAKKIGVAKRRVSGDHE